MTPEARIVTTSEVGEIIDLPTWMISSDLVLVHQGDACVHGDLFLDWDKGWNSGEILARWANWNVVNLDLPAQSICGVVVFGNLTVSGSIVNVDGDSGPHLIVLGNLSARNLVCGGSYVEVKGEASIAEVVFAHYNHGYLSVRGPLHTRVVINDDHAIDIKGATPEPSRSGKKFPAVDYVYISMRDERDMDEEDDALPKKLKKLVSQQLLTWPHVLDKLLSGKSILRAKEDRPPSTIEEWVPLIWSKPALLRKVPKNLRTESLHLALLSNDCPLSDPEIGELVAELPLPALSIRVRVAALELSPKSFLQLPLSVDLQEEYERCFMQVKDPNRVFDGIPIQFRTGTMRDRLTNQDS